MNDDQVTARLTSVDNLFNRLRNTKPLYEEEEVDQSFSSFSLGSSSASIPSGLITDADLVDEKEEDSNFLSAVLPARNSDPIDIPALPPSLDNLIETAGEKAKIARINNTALDILGDTLKELKLRLIEVKSPKDLAKIATDMGKIINGGKDDKKNNGNINQVIIYKPAMSNEHHYETITARAE